MITVTLHPAEVYRTVRRLAVFFGKKSFRVHINGRRKPDARLRPCEGLTPIRGLRSHNYGAIRFTTTIFTGWMLETRDGGKFPYPVLHFEGRQLTIVHHTAAGQRVSWKFTLIS